MGLVFTSPEPLASRFLAQTHRKFQIIWLHSGAVRNENYGNFLQRVWKPCSLWQDDPLIDITPLSITDPEAFQFSLHCDLLVIIQCDTHWLGQVIQQRKQCALATLYEINDDIASLGNWLAATHPLKSPLSRQNLLNLANDCNAVLFSSDELSRCYQTLHTNRFTVDPWVEPLASPVAEKQGFVIGWGGTSSHINDLSWAAPALAEFLTMHADAHFAVMGSCDELATILTDLPAKQVTFYPFGDEEAYFRFIQSLHVGIAPLQDTRFNRCRSDGKFVQYAINGCASLLSDLPPFSPHRERAVLFDSPESMFDALEQLYQDRTALTCLADKAASWAQTHRSPQAVKHHLRSIFTTFLPAQPQADWHNLARWSEESREIWERARQLVKNNHHEEAIVLYAALLDQQTDLPEVRWLVMQSLLAMGRYEQALNTALSTTDDAIWQDEFAAAAYMIARRFYPHLTASILARIRHPLQILRLRGLPAHDMENHFRRTLNWLPYDYFALFGLVQILQKTQPDSKELHQLRLRAELIAPERLQ